MLKCKCLKLFNEIVLNNFDSRCESRFGSKSFFFECEVFSVRNETTRKHITLQMSHIPRWKKNIPTFSNRNQGKTKPKKKLSITDNLIHFYLFDRHQYVFVTKVLYNKNVFLVKTVIRFHI